MSKFKCEEFTTCVPFTDNFEYVVAVKVDLPIGLDSCSGEVALTPLGKLVAYRFLGQTIPSPLYNEQGWCTWLTTKNQSSNNPLKIEVYGEGDCPFNILIDGRVEYGFNFEHEEKYDCFGVAVKAHIHQIDSDKYRIIEGNSYN